MAINLQKGQRASLDSSMRLALVGLGWDENDTGGEDFDLDASAFLLGPNGLVPSDDDFVFYGNQTHYSGAVRSTGDDTSGGNSEDGDDEQLIIDFAKLPANIEKIAICVTIYDAANRRQNFGQVRNAYVRVCKINTPNDEDGQELLRYYLDEDFSIETAIVVCEIYRRNGEWKFNAVGQGYSGELAALCRKFGINV